MSPRQVSTLQYAEGAVRAGELYLPRGQRPAPVVCLLHGGFWLPQYGRDQFAGVAADLCAHGYAVWNFGYRRIGEPGGGFPGTLQDVAAGIDFLTTVANRGAGLDLARVAVAGHSAGGHLALWSAVRARSHIAGVAAQIIPKAVVGMAPVSDLVSAAVSGVGGGVVQAFLGGEPGRVTDRYASASPMQLLPLQARTLVIHGLKDDIVPIAMSRAFVAAARTAGDKVDFVELADGGHFDFLNPAGIAHHHLITWLPGALEI